MKKYGLIALAVVLLAAYPATTWYFGKQIEATVAQHYEAVKDLPFLKVVKRDFQRGIYRSVETTTLELFGELAKAQSQGGGKAALEPVQVTLRTEYRHGPLADLMPAATVADTEIVLDEASKPMITKLFGDQKPVAMRTVLKLGGGGTTRLTIPAFGTSFDGDDGPTSLNWGGASMDVDFNAELSAFTSRGALPALQVSDGSQARMAMTDLRFSSDQKRLVADDPLVFSGTQQLTVGQLEVVPKDGARKVNIQGLKYDTAIPVSGDFVDIAGQLAMAVVQVDGKDFGPVHWDYALRHLQAAKLVALSRNVRQLLADPNFASQTGDPSAVLLLLTQSYIDLLLDNPELRLDRLSFRGEGGEANLSARATLKEAKQTDFSDPTRLLAKLEASAELAVPEALLDSIAGGAGKSPEETATNQVAAKQQLAAVIEQGFAVRDGGMIRSRASFANGQLSVNGKPIPLGGEATPAAAPTPVPAETDEPD